MRVAMLLGCVSLAVVSGCSFPEPTLVDLAGGDSSVSDSTIADTGRSDALVDASTVDSSTDGTTDAGPADADANVDDQGVGETTDAPVATDSRADTPDAVNCDKDNDLSLAKGGTCGGLDCDDNDPNAKPSVNTFLTLDATGKPHGGDWNCDGNVEKQFTTVNINCGSYLLNACAGKKGFTGDPACGKSGDWVECSGNGVTCGVGSTKTEIQGCK